LLILMSSLQVTAEYCSTVPARTTAVAAVVLLGLIGCGMGQLYSSTAPDWLLISRVLVLSLINGLLLGTYIHGTVCHCGDVGLLGDQSGDEFVAIGVNHRATKFATTASVTVYNFKRLEGLKSFADNDDEMSGSAEKYLGKDSKVAKYLYALTFSRKCGGRSHCVDVATSGKRSLPLDGTILFIERLYVNPVSKAGPDPAEMIYGELLHFAPGCTGTYSLTLFVLVGMAAFALKGLPVCLGGGGEGDSDANEKVEMTTVVS